MKKIIEALKLFALAICASCAFSMNYNVWIYDTFAGKDIELVIYIFAFFVLFKYANKKMSQKIKFVNIVAFFLASMYVAGHIFLKEVVIDNKSQYIMILTALIGYYAFYKAIIYIMREILLKDVTYKNKYIFKYPFKSSLVILLVAWIIPLLIKFPAGICWDSSWQIEQGLGMAPLSEHHPVMHTILMGWFLKFGKLVCSYNLGIFLFVFVETIIMALIYAYAISFLVKIEASNISVYIALAFFAFSPMVTGYVGQVIKDVYFTSFSVWFTVLIAEYCFFEKEFLHGIKKSLFLILSAIFMTLSRNNGVYVVISCALLIIFYVIIIKKREARFKTVMIMILMCLLCIVSNKLVKIVYNPETSSIAEALSLPIQQTARVVKYHENSLTEKEKEVIGKLLPYDRLSELYNPYISDPVKSQYNIEATNDEIKEFLKIWIGLIIKEPVSCVNATLQQNVILLYPDYNNYAYYYKYNQDNYEYHTDSGQIFSCPQWLKNLQQKYYKMLVLSHSLPILSLINNMSTYVILMVILTLLHFDAKKKKSLYLLPIWMACGIIILAPCIRWHFRYAFPIIYTMPIIIGLYTSKKEKEING